MTTVFLNDYAPFESHEYVSRQALYVVDVSEVLFGI